MADAVLDAVNVRRLLSQNTQELSSLMKALNGEYVLPQAGGDLLRDGPGVLPTGRNIHALDPYRMPSAAAAARGAAAGAAILEAHAAANDGALPETVAVNLWGLDSIKTRGDNVGLVLWLVGARPVREGTGRIARFELVPLEELGRPRIDVLCNMSGIFRCGTWCMWIFARLSKVPLPCPVAVGAPPGVHALAPPQPCVFVQGCRPYGPMHAGFEQINHCVEVLKPGMVYIHGVYPDMRCFTGVAHLHWSVGTRCARGASSAATQRRYSAPGSRRTLCVLQGLLSERGGASG